jgi:hypothetical protein
MLDRPGQFRICLEKRRMFAAHDLARVVAIEQRPIGPVDADDLLGLDAMP